MNFFRLILLLIPTLTLSQTPEFKKAVIDSLEQETYIIIEGDTIVHNTIDLNEVMLLHDLKFDSKEDRIRYLILKRKTLKVYPYAKLAADRLEELQYRLDSLGSKRAKRKYTKMIQDYLEGEFTDKLKKMTRTEGQILVKLVHRQTGETVFEIIKDLKSGWKAFWSNNTAALFDISLKAEFDPEDVKEDYLIEDILQRNFQNGRLVRQKPAVEFDFYELTEKWLN
ncbi:DUF4294 domain-containing protein [Mangrovimonas aestuarii]|uniref:DUF4294 domain-containing protein n=1 Tax=Mangrovimonas aestuarii TaxID=3018443 RepID=UPI002378E2B5|nr:DUF4294 domain-containing protein [Mangrovimonas aestuarii]